MSHRGMTTMFSILTATIALVTCGRARSSDAFNSLMYNSREIVQLQIINGSITEKGSISERRANKYFVRNVKFVVGRHVLPEGDVALICNCRLKVGGSYLAFIAHYDDTTYIRAAYEILDVTNGQVKALGLNSPIVVTADTDPSVSQPLFIFTSFPKNYKRGINAYGKYHEILVNSWYPLDVAIDSIRKSYNSVHKGHKNGSS